MDLAKEVGVKWRILGIYLGLQACDVDVLDMDYPLTANKAFHMLVQWRDGLSSKTDARELLGKGLGHCGLRRLQEKITGRKIEVAESQETKKTSNYSEDRIKKREDNYSCGKAPEKSTELNIQVSTTLITQTEVQINTSEDKSSKNDSDQGIWGLGALKPHPIQP